MKSLRIFDKYHFLYPQLQLAAINIVVLVMLSILNQDIIIGSLMFLSIFGWNLLFFTIIYPFWTKLSIGQKSLIYIDIFLTSILLFLTTTSYQIFDAFSCYILYFLVISVIILVYPTSKKSWDSLPISTHLHNAFHKIPLITHSYTRFAFKKGIFYLIVIFIALSFSFAIPRFMPGDPATRMLRPPPIGADPESLAQYREIKQRMLEYYGLNESLGDQFVEFWIHMFEIDLGTSYVYYPTPVLNTMLPRVVLTLLLVLPSLFISFFIGNWIGGRSAFLKGRLNDLVYYACVLAQSAPFYWVGLIVFVLFVTGNNQFFLSHPGGMSPEMFPPNTLTELFTQRGVEFLIDFIRHYLAPFLTLTIVATGGWATGMRAMTLYEKEAEYLLYAEQMGFKTQTLRQYAQRNAILPQITGLNLRLNELIGSSIIIEAIFQYPGVGSLAGLAIGNQDYPLVIGTFLITLVVVVIGNFIVDIAYGFIDPRIKTGHRG